MINKLFILSIVLALTIALPYDDQMTLANSLIVGREEDLYDWICKVCDDTNRPLHSHYIEQNAVDIKCVLSVYPQFIVLAFRYTNTALNVWQDILYPIQIVDEHTCSNCKVQKQYNNMWETIKQNVTRDLIQIRNLTGTNLLYITGISLGGGLSVISFIDINQAQLFPKIKVTTYGAPRVGNKYWAAHFDEITGGYTRRFIVSGDPITVLPRCLTLLCTYRHTGIKIVCYEELEECNQEEEVPDDFSFGFKPKIIDSDIKNMGSIVDHIDGYPKIYGFTLHIK